MKLKAGKKTIIATALLSLCSIAVSFSLFGKTVSSVDARGGDYSVPLDGYYDEITATSGRELTGQVHDLIVKTHQNYTTYDDNGKNGLQKQADYDPENPSNIIEWYSGMPMPNAWNPVTGGYNREHVWCQSLSNGLWGEKGGGADMHHLRPVEVSLNTARNNSPYGIVPNRENYKKYPKDLNKNYITDWCGGYKTNDVFEPIDSKKGDVARVVMYTYLHYSTYANVGGTTNGSGGIDYFGTLPITNVISAANEQDAWKLLIDWNNMDPVDILEINRNEAVAKFQGNRNPFIDHPEYAAAMWGDQPLPPPTSEPSSSTIESSPIESSLAPTSQSGGGNGCGGAIESTLSLLAIGLGGCAVLTTTWLIKRAKERK
ncbi:MAG: endonuclease [Bacilli bacterium]|nr:endonuclease [Bacilli bacterium]